MFGVVVLGLLLVLDPWTRVVGILFAAPGAFLLLLSAADGLASASGAVRMPRAWRRLLAGTLWLTIASAVSAVVALFVATGLRG